MDKKPTLEQLKEIQEAKRIQLAEARRVSQQLQNLKKTNCKESICKRSQFPKPNLLKQANNVF